MFRKSVFAFSFLLALAGAASARQFDVQVSMTKADFDLTRANIIAQLDTGRFADIKADDKSAILHALDRISAHLAKPPELMNDQDRIDIFNDQELINEIATHAAADSRIFCERDQPTGSHLVHVTCLPVSKWMERESSGETHMYYRGGGPETCTASSMGRAPAGCGR